MSSPGDPPRDDDPRRPGENQTRAYGPGPYDRPGPGPSDPPYVYNPYGNVSYPSSYPVPPAGLGPDDPGPVARRPGPVNVALVLLLVSAMPYVFVGFLALAGADAAIAGLPAEQLAQLRDLGVDPAQVLRAGGTVLLVIALVFVLLAVLAWTGRRWARALLAAATAGFVLLLVGSFVLAGGQGLPADGASLLVGLLPVVLAVVGVVLMFGAAARPWFDRLRGARRR